MLVFRGQKINANFFVQSFSTTLRVMDVRAENRGRPHQKVRFPAAPVVGRNFLTPGHSGVRVRNVRRKSGPKSLCLCCFFFPEFLQRTAHLSRDTLQNEVSHGSACACETKYQGGGIAPFQVGGSAKLSLSLKVLRVRHRPPGPHPRIRLALPSSGVDLASMWHRFDLDFLIRPYFDAKLTAEEGRARRI